MDRDSYLLMLGRCKIDIVGIQKKKGRKERRRKEGRGRERDNGREGRSKIFKYRLQLFNFSEFYKKRFSYSLLFSLT